MTSKTSRQQSALLSYNRSYITEKSINSGYSTISLEPVSLTRNHKNDHENQTNIKFCKYLDFVMYSQLLWITKRPGNKCRKGIVNCIGISFLFFLAVLYSAIFTIAQTQSIPHHPVSESTVFQINITLHSLLITLCRLLQIYYFVYKFNFPWHNAHLIHYHPNLLTILQQFINSKMKTLNKCLIIYVMIGVILLVGLIVFLVYLQLLECDCILLETRSLYISIFVLAVLLIQIPTILFPIIWSVIAFKFRFKLYYLQCLMKKSEYTPDFVHILEQYKSFYHQFKKEQKFWKLYMLLSMSYFGSYLWVAIDIFINMAGKCKDCRLWVAGKCKDDCRFCIFILWICFCIFIFIMPLIGYIMASSGMNCEYNQFIEIFHHYEDNAEACKSSYFLKKQTPAAGEKVVDSSSMPSFADSNTQSVLIRKKTISSVESLHLLSRYGSKRKKRHMTTPNYTMDVKELRTIVYNSNHFHLLVNYVSRFAIQAELCGVELRTVEILRFLAGFFIVKWLSYTATVLQP